jgi:PucR family transcriptional regulator, purine catabolism regulatory protein
VSASGEHSVHCWRAGEEGRILERELTVADVLMLEVVQRADPLVLHGNALEQRTVRWVHTSELVEAAAMLQGGELLLTTGLGLAGRGPVAQSGYVEQLAASGAAPLALELGWTFPEVTEELLAAARAHDLPLIALRRIVPFVEITEVVQREIMRQETARYRARRQVDELLDQSLESGAIWGFVDGLASVAACPVVTETLAGHPFAWAGLAADSDPHDELTLADDLNSAEIRVFDRPWGWLHLLDPPPARPELTAASLERGPRLIALALIGGQEHPLPIRTQLEQTFMEDLVRGLHQEPEILARRMQTIELRAPVAAATFSELRYAPFQGGFSVVLAYGLTMYKVAHYS